MSNTTHERTPAMGYRESVAHALDLVECAVSEAATPDREHAIARLRAVLAGLDRLHTEWERAAETMRPKYDMSNGYGSNEDAAHDAQADIYAECAEALRTLVAA